MSKAKIILLHAVMETSLGDYHPIMPVGFFSMAHVLDTNGFDVEIVNVAAEKVADRKFRVEDYVKDALFVGIDLHWYLHSFSAIETARRIKQSNPGLKIILGGYTSSFFANEILSTYPFIDAVIKGEAELPLLQYALALERNEDLREVPNLFFREDNQIVQNEKRWTATVDEINSYSFARIDLVKNADIYLRISLKSPVVEYANTPSKLENTFYLFTDRGCLLNCPYCGGSRSVMNELLSRECSWQRSVKNTFEEIKFLVEKGYNHISIESDPARNGNQFYREFFKLIPKEWNLGLDFTARQMPDETFLEDFSRVFDLNRSGISLSPDTGSEKLRKKIKSAGYYSNEQLLSFIHKAKDRGVYVTACFTTGMPFETNEDFQETLSLIREIKKLNVKMPVFSFKLEPGSAIYNHPEEFEIIPFRRTFQDYYEHTRALAKGLRTKSILGYRTKNFSEKEILRMQHQAFQAAFLKHYYIMDRFMSANPFSLRRIITGLGVIFKSSRLLQIAFRE